MRQHVKLSDVSLGSHPPDSLVADENATKPNKQKFLLVYSAFPQPSSHTTTWVGQRRDPHTKKIIPIYNQIDYIICHRRYKHLATNARSYRGTIVTSDQKLVITTFKLEWFEVWRKRTTQSTPKINTSNIVNRQECRLSDQQRLDTQLLKIGRESCTPNKTWKCVKEAVQNTAQQTAGVITNRKPNRTPDTEISNLSQRQKELGIKINNTKEDSKKIELTKKEMKYHTKSGKKSHN